MSLRPGVALWFELLSSREELGAVLEGLAHTGAVQLQAVGHAESRLALRELRSALDEHATLARRFEPWWPPPRRRPGGRRRDEELTQGPRQAVARLQAWAALAEPVVTRLEGILQARHETRLLLSLVQQDGAALPRLDRLASAGPVLAGRVYALSASAAPLSLPAAVLEQRVATAAGPFLVALGSAADMSRLDEALATDEARRIALPRDLPADVQALPSALERGLASLADDERGARQELTALDAAHRIDEALAEIAHARWVLAHVPALPVTEHFAWVTGWCSDRDDARLRAALDRSGLHYLLRVVAAPAGEVPPSVLRNPRWAQPFEVFSDLMGVPTRGEADPSIIVALMAPLLFGYMFGDVAQGLIVAVAAWLLRARLPALRIMVPGGLVAMVFGFAFGSVFAREDLLPALWVHPLAEPLLILGVALAFGAIVLTLGQLLDALQHAWSGELRRWLGSDAGVLLAYLGLVTSVLDLRALWALPIGAAWALAGAALVAQDRLHALGVAAGTLVERLLQLAVNTISFVRVGAFALAHAGLCVAVVGVAEAAGPGYWPVLIVGNAAIVALEGLVVGIQTTRLILFEFFIRFLTARGRRFEPLPSPADIATTTPGTPP